MAAIRSCRVSVRDAAGVTHAAEVKAATLFEAAAAAVATFRQAEWAAEALTPSAVLRVEVQLPAVVHDVPLKALEAWLQSPSPSPRDLAAKRRAGRET